MDVYEVDKKFKGINHLVKGEYENCSFISCNFSNSDLSHINFIECEFEGCDLSMATLFHTGFREAKFTDCKMLGLRFENCDTLLFSAGFVRCTLNHSSFYRLKLKNTSFEECNLQDADFTETDLSGASLSQCDLLGATFENTALEKTDLRTAYNFSIDPEGSRITKAKFSTANIIGLLRKYDIEVE